MNKRTIPPFFLALSLGLLFLLVGCNVATRNEATPPAADALTTQPALAVEAEPTATTAALAPVVTTPTSDAPAVATVPQSTSTPDGYPEPDVAAVALEPYPAPAEAEGLEGYPGVEVVGSPESLDINAALLGSSLPLLLERLGGGETVADLEKLEDPLVALIAADAAERAEVNLPDVTLISMQPVTWPATHLGCPDPELGYAEVEIEGYILTVSAGNSTYTYHTDGGLQIILCQDALPEIVTPSSR